MRYDEPRRKRQRNAHPHPPRARTRHVHLFLQAVFHGSDVGKLAGRHPAAESLLRRV
jgi:hypothetical protein